MGAIIKGAGGSSKGGTAGLEKYLKQEHKTEKILMYGKDCNISNFAKEFESTRKLYEKTDGRQHIHIIQSWRTGEVTPEQAHEIGQEFLKHNKFKEFQAVCITHKDKDNIHNHFVINSVSLETGKKYQQTKKEYQELKNYSNEINLKQGIEIEEKKENPGQVRAYDKDKYQILKKAFEGKAKSYLVDTVLAVEKSLEKATSKKEFISQMSEQGYKTTWTEERKNITFENKEGQKVRLSNLEKTFSDSKYTKEGLENEFKRVEREKETGRTSATTREQTEYITRNDYEEYGADIISKNEYIGSGTDESRKYATQTDIKQLHEQLSEIRGFNKEFDIDEQRRIKERAEQLKADMEREKRRIEEQHKLAEQRNGEKAQELEKQQRNSKSRGRDYDFGR